VLAAAQPIVAGGDNSAVRRTDFEKTQKSTRFFLIRVKLFSVLFFVKICENSCVLYSIVCSLHVVFGFI
jgi:hypothetical protein